MTKNEFIVGDEYVYQGTHLKLTYLYPSRRQFVGIFKSYLGDKFHYEYESMNPCTNPEPKYPETKYPNPPLPHCGERIAFARGANIEYFYSGTWHCNVNPQFNKGVKYRVKVEKTKDDLRIEELEENIRAHENCAKVYKKELAKLKPTVHY